MENFSQGAKIPCYVSGDKCSAQVA